MPSRIQTRILPGFLSESFQDSHQSPSMILIRIYTILIRIFSLLSLKSSRDFNQKPQKFSQSLLKVLIRIKPNFLSKYFSTEYFQDFHRFYWDSSRNIIRILQKKNIRILPEFFLECFQDSQQSPSRILIWVFPGMS